ncbi:MAG: 6-oxocyclohex-1-ene-1-carbonyl-CoA hydratase [Sandaracinaceae bacterium]|nr:6-oxocyclohex-1-ene-1-carbonyl-CoA hydratase [Sandaracinaceae bacterium]
MGEHELVPSYEFSAIKFAKRPVRDGEGAPVEGLFSAWIQLDNPKELNSYTTQAVREVILAFRRASEDPSVVAVVFTGTGDRAFCTGGNTREYATFYSGHPARYRAYMRLFNDMVTAILHCDKPVICRVNGMRIGGGQEIGMACDFSIAQDLARFGQAGPKHGSAPVGGSTDFLPLFVGIERAMESATLCEHWSAHKSLRLGLLTEVVPALRVDGELVPNPLVETSRWIDERTGRVVYGEAKTGDEAKAAKALFARGTVDLGPLDAAVERFVSKLAGTMPDCLAYTLENVRRHKLAHWDKNREGNRAWLALNMMTEAKAGFRAFHFKPNGEREVDFTALRRALASGGTWNEELFAELGVDDASCAAALKESEK